MAHLYAFIKIKRTNILIWADFEQERVAANAALQCNLSVDITRKMQKAEAPLSLEIF